jgi:hypothetical protein
MGRPVKPLRKVQACFQAGSEESLLYAAKWLREEGEIGAITLECPASYNNSGIFSLRRCLNI